MNRFKYQTLAIAGLLCGLMFIGIKPTQAEFVCWDSTSRCNDVWGGSIPVPADSKQLLLAIYGYEFYHRPVFWLVFISVRQSDLATPKDTRVSWFNSPFEKSGLIPGLAIRKMENEDIDDRYELTISGNLALKVIMGVRNRFYNPFRFKNGKSGEWVR